MINFVSPVLLVVITTLTTTSDAFVSSSYQQHHSSHLMMASSSSSSTSSSSSSSSSSRRDILTAGSAAAIAVALGGGCSGLLIDPSSASAAQITAQSAANRENESYQGVWADPRHPNGYRVIMTKGGDAATGTAATMTLSDGLPEDADPSAVAKTFTNVPVKVNNNNDGKKNQLLTIDFSFKGGPKDIIATLADDKQSMTFQDGNTWIKNKQKYDGVYKDPKYPQGYIVVRKQKGTNLIVEINKTGNAKDSTFVTGRIGSLYSIPTTDITFDFPSGPVVAKLCLLDRNTVWSYGTITFPVGNTIVERSLAEQQRDAPIKEIVTPDDLKGAVWTRQ